MGAAVGLAVLGAVGATLASSHWEDDVAKLPAAARGPASALEELVIGGQGQVVGRIAGPAAGQSAAESFVVGVQGAMWVGAALTFAAALTAFFGLRGTPSPAAAPSRPTRGWRRSTSPSERLTAFRRRGAAHGKRTTGVSPGAA